MYTTAPNPNATCCCCCCCCGPQWVSGWTNRDGSLKRQEANIKTHPRRRPGGFLIWRRLRRLNSGSGWPSPATHNEKAG